MKTSHVPDEAAILKAMATAPAAMSVTQPPPGRKVSAVLGNPIRKQVKK